MPAMAGITLPSPYHRIKYGAIWDPYIEGVAAMPDILIEMEILRMYKAGEYVFKKCKGYCWHFMEAAKLIWGDPNGQRYFQWNPYAVKMLEKIEEYPMLAVAAHADASKSEFGALYGCLNFIIWPFETKVLITSTTQESAEGKVWGALTLLWQAANVYFQQAMGESLPGKLLETGMVRYEYTDPETKITTKSKTVGIELMPCNDAKAKQTVSKLQGYKGGQHMGRVIFIGDEFATCPPSILQTVKENLIVRPGFKGLFLFNFDSLYDSGGMVATPKAGWSSVTTESSEWETEYGYCLRFDGLKSPNVLSGKRKINGVPEPGYYLGLLDREGLAIHEATQGGRDTPGFWRMIRAWPNPTGSKDCIYNEHEIARSETGQRETRWAEPWIWIAGLDPSFTHGGDKAVLTIARVGLAYRGEAATQTIVRVIEIVAVIVLDQDVNDKFDKTEQVVRLTKEYMNGTRSWKASANAPEIRFDVHPSNLGVDITGAGGLVTLISQQIGSGFLAINFKETPSDKPVSKADPRPAHKRFLNRMSEIWYVLKELVGAGQIRGLNNPAAIRQMCARTYEDVRGIVQVEPKEKMKKRTQHSPDEADSIMVCVDVGRQRNHVVTEAKAKATPALQPHEFFQQKQKQKDIRYRQVQGFAKAAGWGRGALNRR